MPEEQVEKEPKERVVEVGEWFNPFIGYHDKPFEESSEKIQRKSFYFDLKGVGSLEAELGWEKGEWEDIKKAGYHREVLLVLPNNFKVSKENQLHDEQAKIETKVLRFLIHVGHNNQRWVEEDFFPSLCEIKLPDGSILEMENAFDASLPGFLGGSVVDSKEDIAEVLIPEAEQILEKIQMRIVPIEES